jgi:hypothetical protein
MIPRLNKNHPWAPYVVGYYPFFHEYGRAIDIGPYRLHSDSASATRPVVNSDYGRAALRLTSDRYYNVSDAALGSRYEWSANERWTIIATAYFVDTGTDANAAFVGKGDSQSQEWMFGVSGSTLSRFYADAGTVDIDGATLSEGWYNWIAYQEPGATNSDITFYLNGVDHGTQANVNQAFGFTSKNLSIGLADNALTRTWEGAIEQLIVLNGYTFTPEDVVRYENNRYLLLESSRHLVPTPTRALEITCAVTGTATASIDEADITGGGKTIILTLTNSEWVPAGATFDPVRQDIIDGITSAQSEGTGWNNEVRDKEVVGSVVRTSDSVVTITLTSSASYDITAQETITATVPASAIVGTNQDVIASPTFTVDTAAGVGPGTDEFSNRKTRGAWRGMARGIAA